MEVHMTRQACYSLRIRKIWGCPKYCSVNREQRQQRLAVEPGRSCREERRGYEHITTSNKTIIKHIKGEEGEEMHSLFFGLGFRALMSIAMRRGRRSTSTWDGHSSGPL